MPHIQEVAFAARPLTCGQRFSAAYSHPVLTAMHITCDLEADTVDHPHEGPDGAGGRLVWRETAGLGSDPVEWMVDA